MEQASAFPFAQQLTQSSVASRAAHPTETALFPACWLGGCPGGPSAAEISSSEEGPENRRVCPAESLMSKISSRQTAEAAVRSRSEFPSSVFLSPPRSAFRIEAISSPLPLPPAQPRGRPPQPPWSCGSAGLPARLSAKQRKTRPLQAPAHPQNALMFKGQREEGPELRRSSGQTRCLLRSACERGDLETLEDGNLPV